ncbi:hypothetical protein ACP70R_020436 [Stipagrostis hirtigluma subsp. patula]
MARLPHLAPTIVNRDPPASSNVALACAASTTAAEEATERAMAAEAEGSEQQLPEPGMMRMLEHMQPPAMSFFSHVLAGSGLRLADLTEGDVGRMLRQILEVLDGHPPLDGSSAPYLNGGLGAVAASAAAVAGLEKQTVRCGGGGGGEGCAICLVDFEDGEEVSVMPCASGHEFHPDCIVEWLARSNMCPLCRHALPT